MSTESQINDILAHPLDHEWTLQGFGMLRMYLDPGQVERLHIWDTGMAVADVSTIHDHPWDFTSRIVRGSLVNERFVIDDRTIGMAMSMAKIKTGEGGGLIGAPEPVRLVSRKQETYHAGDTYSQLAPEFHESLPAPGTVTVITRSFHADRDTATVCWREGDWVSAEPRPATREEIEHFISIVAPE